jgi:hypothetical protein
VLYVGDLYASTSIIPGEGFQFRPKLVALYRSFPSTGLQEADAARISRQSKHGGGKVVSPTHRPPLPPTEDLSEAESTTV